MKFDPTWYIVDGCGACLVKAGGRPENIEDRVALIEKTPRVRISHRHDNQSQEHRNWKPGPKGDDAMDEESRAWCVDELKSLGWTAAEGL